MSTSLNPFGFARSRLSALWLAFFVAVTSGSAASRWATLEAIHHLENPYNLSRPGAHGELGAYQFKRTTWQMHTRVPFAHALDRSVSDEVAVQHYEWLKRGLEKAGRPATPYFIALAWNSGLGSVTRGSAPRVAHDYAQRAANLAAAFDRDSPRRIADAR